METFYTSFNMQGNLVLFNAPDYRLYAYDKKSGEEKWSYDLQRKSNISPFFIRNHIWATSGDKEIIKLDTTGKRVKAFAFPTMETQPVVKGNILYGTGISEIGGCLFAYDLDADSILWKRFLAHGCSKTPYYLADKIVANAEGDNWIEIAYNGKLKDPACDIGEEIFPSQLPCAKKFKALTHDGKPINEKLAEKLFLNEYSEPAIFTTLEHTFILNDGHLTILGDKLKHKAPMLLASLSDTIEENMEGLVKILKAGKETVSILYSNQLIVYNHRNKKLVKTIDLSAWEPHQALPDGDRLWLISKKDGLLYGLLIE